MSYSAEAQTIRRLAVQLQGMDRAAEALEKMGPIEDALAEGQQKLIEAQETLAARVAEIETATAQSRAIHQASEAVQARAVQESDTLLVKAKSAAAQIIGEATEQAQVIRAGEIAKREEALQGLVDASEKARQDLAAIAGERAALVQETAEAKEQLNGIQAAILSLKQYAKQLAAN